MIASSRTFKRLEFIFKNSISGQIFIESVNDESLNEIKFTSCW